MKSCIIVGLKDSNGISMDNNDWWNMKNAHDLIIVDREFFLNHKTEIEKLVLDKRDGKI